MAWVRATTFNCISLIVVVPEKRTRTAYNIQRLLDYDYRTARRSTETKRRRSNMLNERRIGGREVLCIKAAEDCWRCLHFKIICKIVSFCTHFSFVDIGIVHAVAAGCSSSHSQPHLLGHLFAHSSFVNEVDCVKYCPACPTGRWESHSESLEVLRSILATICNRLD